MAWRWGICRVTCCNALQASLVHICEARPDLCEGFLNRLFAMLNWTLTEFTVSAQVLALAACPS